MDFIARVRLPRSGLVRRCARNFRAECAAENLERDYRRRSAKSVESVCRSAEFLAVASRLDTGSHSPNLARLGPDYRRASVLGTRIAIRWQEKYSACFPTIRQLPNLRTNR